MESAGDIVQWADCNIKTLHLSHRNPATGNPIKAEYSIQVRRFVPEPGDMLHQGWIDVSTAQHKTHPIQPYAVTNLDELTAEINRYIVSSIIPFVVEIVGYADPVIWQTYVLAWTRGQAPTVVSFTEKTSVL